jgi:cysteine desulfurase
MKEIYLDNAATTRVSEEVLQAMNPFFTKRYGNASSLHAKGDEAVEAVNSARKKIAREIGCKAHEIIFTSGATEANNIAIQATTSFRTTTSFRKRSSRSQENYNGSQENYNGDKKKIIISSIEHPSVSEVADNLEKRGFLVRRIGVNKEGFIDLDFLEKEIDENTAIVSVMYVNNIFGTIQDLRKIGRLCRQNKTFFHTDAVQGFGKLKIDVNDWCIDLLSASAHKIGGPKGSGFLYVRDGIELSPMFYGGGQERGFRSGTENVPGIVGLGKSLELYRENDWREIQRIRDLFISKLEEIGGKINGPHGDKRIYNNVHVSFPGINSEDLIIKLSTEGIYVSAGSACDSKKQKKDLVLKALGLSKKESESSIRISLGDDIGGKEVETVVKVLKRLINE